MLAIAGGVFHVINYVLEQDVMTRAEIETVFTEERDNTEDWVSQIASQHDYDRGEIKQSVQSLDGRVDLATAAISNLQASISAINVHISTIKEYLRELKQLLDRLVQQQLE